MKKLSLLIFYAFLILHYENSANAMKLLREEIINKKEKPLHLGIEAGFNTSTLHGNDTLTYMHYVTAGYTGGVTLQYYLSNKFSLNTGMTYSRTGTHFKWPVKGTSGRVISNISGDEAFNYLSIPLLIRVEHGRRLKYFIYGGGYYSILLKEERNFDKSSANYPDGERTNSFKKSDAGVTGGLGISYTTKNLTAFTLDVRNNFGLIDISTSSSYLGGTVNTYFTCFLLAISFPLSK